MEKLYQGELLYWQRRRLQWGIPAISFGASLPLMHVVRTFARDRWSYESLSDWVYLVLMVACSLTMLYVAWSLPRLNRNAAVQLQVWKEVRRTRPHECPWCGQDIPAGSTPACPECGKPYDPPEDSTVQC